MQRSFLKWAGGKSSALPHIKPLLPQEGECWIEPFMGSATVALNMEYKHFILNDFNPDLVFLCAWVAKKPKQVIEQARELFCKKNNSKKTFYQLREQYNRSKDPKERALLFLYINRHGYNGLMRYNQSGKINTPFGSYASPRLPEAEIHAFSVKLKNARFVCGSFDKLRFMSREKQTCVYCDPPYLPASTTASFASYTALGFPKKMHLQLDKKCAKWSSRSSGVWLSNHEVPLLDKCYRRATSKTTFMVPRTISSAIDKRVPVAEALLYYGT